MIWYSWDCWRLLKHNAASALAERQPNRGSNNNWKSSQFQWGWWSCRSDHNDKGIWITPAFPFQGHSECHFLPRQGRQGESTILAVAAKTEIISKFLNPSLKIFTDRHAILELLLVKRGNVLTFSYTFRLVPCCCSAKRKPFEFRHCHTNDDGKQNVDDYIPSRIHTCIDGTWLTAAHTHTCVACVCVMTNAVVLLQCHRLCFACMLCCNPNSKLAKSSHPV